MSTPRALMKISTHRQRKYRQEASQETVLGDTKANRRSPCTPRTKSLAGPVFVLCPSHVYENDVAMFAEGGEETEEALPA